MLIWSCYCCCHYYQRLLRCHFGHWHVLSSGLTTPLIAFFPVAAWRSAGDYDLMIEPWLITTFGLDGVGTTELVRGLQFDLVRGLQFDLQPSGSSKSNGCRFKPNMVNRFQLEIDYIFLFSFGSCAGLEVGFGFGFVWPWFIPSTMACGS